MSIPRRNLFFIIFAVSGFSGLIYESIWTHYLKLFLGHAAYAQTLVLTIFMGGMALGSWIISRFSTRWRNLLLGYAAVEGIIGLLGLLFHGTFTSVTDLAYRNILPGVGSDALAMAAVWVISGFLILPQSILLGMTFPLMSAALIRQDPDHPGELISMLYFTNSIGAAIGVLISGFILIEWVGLPGTLLTAGGLNLFVALAMVMLIRSSKPSLVFPAMSHQDLSNSRGDARPYFLFLFVSLMTGLASFIYEIGWIRMLNLVLGSATHAFELMLSAFIFGLAFGGLWIRRRLDRFAHPEKVLGIVQVAMGCLAASTLLLYEHTFELMRLIINGLSKTETGYVVFNISSHAIALFIMFPATFLAGMTLPLITHTLIARGYGEKSIGAVYAANTVGAITGVLLAVHLGMPLLGLKNLIVLGAGLDIATGLLLLWIFCRLPNPRLVHLWTGAGICVLLAVMLGIDLDTLKMASGVYRKGDMLNQNTWQVVFHKDGKTATVDILQNVNGAVTLKTNGKSDASLMMRPDRKHTYDENVQILLGILPISYYSEARTAAIIGFGSGLTTHSILQYPSIERVDTIEIEPMIIEASKIYRPRVEAAYTDPRSHIYIEDAKAFFAIHQKKYDIIMSEPSNPWVSGVSSLFTDEFYQVITRHLNTNGILVQWIQMYETEPRLLASAMKALSNHFEDYVLYAADDDNLIIVAKNTGALPSPDMRILSVPNIKMLLERLDIHTDQDLDRRKLGNKKVFDPLFQSFYIPTNSDYYPILDLYAVRARYLEENAYEYSELGEYPVPAVEMLGGKKMEWNTTDAHLNFGSEATNNAYRSMGIRDFYVNDEFGQYSDFLSPALKRHAEFVKFYLSECGFIKEPALFKESLFDIAKATLPYLTPSESNALWDRLSRYRCFQKLPETSKDWINLFRAIGNRDADGMVNLSTKLLAPFPNNAYTISPNLVEVAILGYIVQGMNEKALQLWLKHAPGGVSNHPPNLMMRLLLAHITQSFDKKSDRYHGPD
ncbi:MAG: fused MFS/spermidine synthase [Nitrospirae bacterium]|nr:fused MFS/spermidine synthase [Nitrospirota bacterium]